MNCKAERDISEAELWWFRFDYTVFQENNLGLPNCLICREEPSEVWWTIELSCKHEGHIGFNTCGHVVGVSDI